MLTAEGWILQDGNALALRQRSLPEIAWRAVRSHNQGQSFDQSLEFVEREVVQVFGLGREVIVLDDCPRYSFLLSVDNYAYLEGGMIIFL